MMVKDTILGEIHRFREEYAKRFNNDLKEICNDARRQQGQDGREVISTQPKPIQVIIHR